MRCDRIKTFLATAALIVLCSTSNDASYP